MSWFRGLYEQSPSIGNILTKALEPLWSVKDHPGSIDVMLDGSSPSRFGVTSWSFPAMNVWVEVIPGRPFVSGGRMACGGGVRTSAGGVVTGGMMRLVAWCVHGCFGCCCQNTRRRRLWQRMSNTSRRHQSHRARRRQPECDTRWSWFLCWCGVCEKLDLIGDTWQQQPWQCEML